MKASPQKEPEAIEATKPALEPRDSPLQIGMSAAALDEKLQSTDGNTLTIRSVATSTGALVVFTCNHCPWAKAWESRIVEIGNSARARGLGVIAINPNDPSAYEEDRIEVMAERVAKTGMKFPYVVDGTSNVARAYGASKTPEIFLFDGELRLVYQGAVDDDAKQPDKVEAHYLRDAIDALVAKKPITVATTKAFGCSIKFRD
jgi:hypothetical protein